MSTKKVLGRGLNTLLGIEPKEKNSLHDAKENLVNIPVTHLRKGFYQPRTQINDETLNELADSIRKQGVIQPIIIRPLEEANTYEILAGERRWHAAKKAGLKEIPAIIRKVSNESALAIALIENIQREELSVLEEAHAIQRLANEFSLTHEQLSHHLGKSRTSITNALRLLSLHPEVQNMLLSKKIDMGHARALLSLEINDQYKVAKEIFSKKLTVRQAEDIVRNFGLSAQSKSDVTKEKRLSKDFQTIQEKLQKHWGQIAAINLKGKRGGQIVFSFRSTEELKQLVEHLCLAPIEK